MFTEMDRMFLRPPMPRTLETETLPDGRSEYIKCANGLQMLRLVDDFIEKKFPIACEEFGSAITMLGYFGFMDTKDLRVLVLKLRKVAEETECPILKSNYISASKMANSIRRYGSCEKV